MFAQPNIMSAAPMPRIPPPPRFAAFIMTTPTQMSSEAPPSTGEHLHRHGDVVVH